MISGGVKAFCSWSGGKECTLSICRAKRQGINVVHLLNMVTEDGMNSRSHGLSREILQLQAKRMGISILQPMSSWGTYESIFKKELCQLKKKDVEVGVFGDIDLEEHRVWIERVCNEAGIKPLFPLWESNRDVLLKEFIDHGFSSVIVAVNADLMDKKWLGRNIDSDFINDLRKEGNIDLCGEKGEYHTFVYNGPIFKKQVEVAVIEEVFKDNHWFLKIEGK